MRVLVETPAAGQALAGVPGLEPRLTEPESVVLPITPYPTGHVPLVRSASASLADIDRCSRTGVAMASAPVLSARTASLPHVDRPGGLSRGNETWLLYVVLSCLSFLLNGLGAILVTLQKDLHVDRDSVAFYPTLFAVGLLVVGIVGGRVVGWVGRPFALRVSFGLLFFGGLLFVFFVLVLLLFG